MELFDKKFVHFMWDDELEGKKGFFADDIATLEGFVKSKASVFIVRKSRLKDKPFSIKGGGFRFFYYDPNYEVKKAYAEGKTVQFEYNGYWVDCDNPAFEDEDLYRIKPEEPKSRPFEDFNELMSITGTKLLWVVDKCSLNEFLITGTQKHAVYIVDRWYSMKELFELYTFSDGSPCGIKE